MNCLPIFTNWPISIQKKQQSCWFIPFMTLPPFHSSLSVLWLVISVKHLKFSARVKCFIPKGFSFQSKWLIFSFTKISVSSLWLLWDGVWQPSKDQDQHGSLWGEIVPRGCRRDLTENAPLNLTLLFHVLSYLILTCNCGGIMGPRDYFIQILIPLYELPLLSEIHVNTTILWCMIEPYISSAFCPLVILTSGTLAAPVQERCIATTWQFLYLA